MDITDKHRLKQYSSHRLSEQRLSTQSIDYVNILLRNSGCFNWLCQQLLIVVPRGLSEWMTAQQKYKYKNRIKNECSLSSGWKIKTMSCFHHRAIVFLLLHFCYPISIACADSQSCIQYYFMHSQPPRFYKYLVYRLLMFIQSTELHCYRMIARQEPLLGGKSKMIPNEN